MAVKKNAHIWYIAPTYRQAKNIAWEMMKRWLSHDVFKKNETELTFKFPNGAIIALKGADNEQSLRGTGLDFCVLDEYSDIKPNVWEEIVKPMLADRQGQCWFLGTPRGYNHFYELWNKTDAAKLGADWTAWRLRTADNPYIPREEIERAKAGDERIYRQEWCAEFEAFAGKFFTDFDERIHVIDPPRIEPWYRKVIGIDYGFTAPSAVLWAAVDHDANILVYRELYETQLTYERLAERILEWTTEDIEAIVADPSIWAKEGTLGASGAEVMIKTLQKRNIAFIAGDNDRMIGWGQMREVMKVFDGAFGQKTSRLKISKVCRNLIRTIPSMVYSPSKPEDLEKNQDDHAVDCLRYLTLYLTRMTKSQVPLSPLDQRIRDLTEKRQEYFNPNEVYR